MTFPLQVYVYATDPVSRSGVEVGLATHAEFTIVGDDALDEADVAVVAVEEVDEECLRVIRALQRNASPRVVLMVSTIDTRGLFEAVEAGIAGILRRHEANVDAMAEAVRSAARGHGTLPPDLISRMLGQVRQIQHDVLRPQGLGFGGMSDREVCVLRLVADGLATSEIAAELAYSERTIKNVIHDVTSRLQLRNRSHAVAYAMRQGLI